MIRLLTWLLSFRCDPLPEPDGGWMDWDGMTIETQPNYKP
jgi:hypothetical protein